MRILSLILLICIILFGCDVDSNNNGIDNPNKPETNAQIYNKNDGSLFKGTGIVNATIFPWGGDIWTVQAGTISNGVMNLSFPSIIPDEKLQPFWGDYEYPNAFIMPVEVKFCGTTSMFRFPFIVYDPIGEKIGELKYGKIIMTETGYIADTVFYYYFNQDAAISGFFIFPESTFNQTENYQMNVQKGWNKIYIHETMVNDNILTNYSTELKNIPNDLKWEFE